MSKDIESWDIDEGEELLRLEEHKERWTDYAEINTAINKGIKQLEALKPHYHRNFKGKRLTVHYKTQKQDLGREYEPPSALFLLWGSGTIHVFTYLALLGVTIWLFTGDI